MESRKWRVGSRAWRVMSGVPLSCVLRIVMRACMQVHGLLRGCSRFRGRPRRPHKR